MHVDLHDLGTITRPHVSDRERRRRRVRRDLKPLVVELRVAEPEPKRPRHLDAGRLVVAIPDVDALAIRRNRAVGREVVGARHVLQPPRPRLRQAPRGVRPPQQHVERGHRAGLAAQPLVQDRARLVLPVALDHAAGAQEHHHVRIRLRHAGEKSELSLVEGEAPSVEPLALRGLREPEAAQHHVRPRRQHLRGRERVVARRARAVEARLEPDKPQPRHRDGALERVKLRAVDQRRPRALVARVRRKVSHERHARARRKRQQRLAAGGRLVLQQHDAGGRGPARKLVVLQFVIARRLLHGLARRQHQLHELVHPRINHGLVKLTGLHGTLQLARRAQPARRHLQGRPRAHAGNMVVRRAPVGHHGTLEAPLAAQDLGKQVLVLVGVGAVHAVVAAHDRRGSRLAHAALERREVDLAQRPLVQLRVRRLPARLLAVHGKVLHARTHARRLHAGNVGRGHLAGKARVLREVLEVPPAQRVPLDVDPGPQQNPHALRGGLAPKGCAHAPYELRVPGVGQGNGSGKAGGGQALAQPHVVGPLVLMAQAVRPVGELQRGQPHGRDGPRAERGAAGQQGTLLPETQLGDDALMSHGALPTRPPAPSCRTWP